MKNVWFDTNVNGHYKCEVCGSDEVLIRFHKDVDEWSPVGRQLTTATILDFPTKELICLCCARKRTIVQGVFCVQTSRMKRYELNVWKPFGYLMRGFRLRLNNFYVFYTEQFIPLGLIK